MEHSVLNTDVTTEKINNDINIKINLIVAGGDNSDKIILITSKQVNEVSL